MKRRTILKALAAGIPAAILAKSLKAGTLFSSGPLPESGGQPAVLSILNGQPEAGSIAAGHFQPNWNSLQQYVVPDWFRDAKFGIWAHWGPQCQPEYGDWYARSMYIEGSRDYNYHLKKYGHPSKFGFKDVITEWKAEKWNPDELVELYRRAGAKYFMALANHHDNFDNYNSKYQPWNSLAIGPKKDLIGGWAAAARKQGLRFGVSVHAAHAWSFYEKSQKADLHGPYVGIPYDGKIQRSAGRNTWREGLDPQELYAQDHLPAVNGDDQHIFFQQWDWSHGARIPDKKYCEKFLNRTIDLIDQYQPDLIYFDDTVLPLYPISDVGLRIAAHFYNSNMATHGGKLDAVINGKILDEVQRKCLVWDIERGQSDRIEPLPWQTDTCLGDWHYDRTIFEKHGYKTARSVIHRLADIVSKNGNLMLNVPVRGDGTIDADERAIVEEIGAWININGEAIFETRPWTICGEGPALASASPLSNQGFNEGTGKPYNGEDIRFTTKKDILYAIALGAPANGKLIIKSLAEGSAHYPGKIGRVTLCGTSQTLSFDRLSEGLEVSLPDGVSSLYSYSLRILPA
jgi:alpha-L-fucosidase